MKRVAIMQPTYLPWLGYFALIDRVDCFVFLDSVQFAKRSWQQRNQIKTATGLGWLTVPVCSKGRRDQSIADVEIDATRDFPRGHVKALELAYAKAPYFEQYSAGLFAILTKGNERLAELNIDLIAWFCEQLGITTPVVRSSAMVNEGSKADLLAALCVQLEATEYVSPPGSKAYLDESDAFARIGVPVRYLDYVHPVYPQLYGDFAAYASVVDVLFNVGPEALAVIRAGNRA
jgi:hypothetical protein